MGIKRHFLLKPKNLIITWLLLLFISALGLTALLAYEVEGGKEVAIDRYKEEMKDKTAIAARLLQDSFDTYREKTLLYKKLFSTTFDTKLLPELLNTDPALLQVILLDESGKEQVKIVKEAGEAYAAETLQDAGGMNYFTQAKKLQDKDFYMSPISPRYEQGRLVDPYDLVLTLTTPLQREDGLFYLVVSYSLSDSIRMLASFDEIDLVDHKGIYLYSTYDDNALKGNSGAQEAAIKQRHPEHWQIMTQQATGSYMDGQHIMSHNKIMPFTHMEPLYLVAELRTPIVDQVFDELTLSLALQTLYNLIFLSLVLLLLLLLWRKRALTKEKLLTQSYTDDLTGLYNRKYLLEIIPVLLKKSKDLGHRPGVFYLDLDDFKGVNQAYDQKVGDQLLQDVAKRLKNVLRTSDQIIRLGADQFVVFIPHIPQDEATEAISQKILNVLTHPFYYQNDIIIKIKVSIGFVFHEEDQTFDETLKQAERKMLDDKI